MGVGHVPQDPIRAEGTGPDVQGRQRRGAPASGDLSLAKQARGRWGEEQAARWYRGHDYEVVARNWRVKGGEVDLIVRRADMVAFVEVKTRASDAFGEPSLAVDHRKQARLRRLAAAWLAATGTHGVEVRFDVVSVLGVRVTVIEGAF